MRFGDFGIECAYGAIYAKSIVGPGAGCAGKILAMLCDISSDDLPDHHDDPAASIVREPRASSTGAKAANTTGGCRGRKKKADGKESGLPDRGVARRDRRVRWPPVASG